MASVKKKGLAVLEFAPGHGTPYLACDQQGLVFAASTSTGKAKLIELYDARNVRVLCCWSAETFLDRSAAFCVVFDFSKYPLWCPPPIRCRRPPPLPS